MPISTQTGRVVILGASGYIGQHLTAHLSRNGFQVTAAARRIEWLQQQKWPHVRCCFADVYQSKTLAAAFEGADVLVYLVHAMTEDDDLLEKERQAAQHTLLALKDSQIKHIVYLGSMQPEDNHSPHLQARKLTGDLLRMSNIPVTELRTGIVIGAGSAAFEVMRDMVYNLPVLTPPRWVRSKSSPVALENLLNYLQGLVTLPATGNRILEAAGPEYISYQTLFERFIAMSGKRRWLIPIPLPTSLVSVYFLSLITSVPTSLAKALIQGLNHDLPADSAELQRLIPQDLISIDDAICSTLEQEQKQVMDSPDWGYDPDARARWRPGYGYYPKQAGFTLETSASKASLWKVVQQLGGQEGYFYANGLWKTRARMDDLLGGGVKYGRPDRDFLKIGDKIDGWKVIGLKPQRELALLFGMKAPGLGRLTFTITDNGESRSLDVRAWWHPAGFSGLLYWFSMMPAHRFIFRGMAKRIASLARQKDRCGR